MAKPPADIDPEKFVIGGGLYTDESFCRLVGDETTFRIEPARPSYIGIVIFDLVILAAAFGVFRLIDRSDRFVDEPWIRYSPLLVGVFTCVVATIVPWTILRAERRRGPWLIFDKRDGGVQLPREGESFLRDEIVCLQHVTTKDLKWGGVLNNERRTELNLITERAGARRRWPLLRSTSTFGAPFIQTILAHTGLTILRVTDSDRGWETTETPHRRVVRSRLPSDRAGDSGSDSEHN